MTDLDYTKIFPGIKVFPNVRKPGDVLFEDLVLFPQHQPIQKFLVDMDVNRLYNVHLYFGGFERDHLEHRMFLIRKTKESYLINWGDHQGKDHSEQHNANNLVVTLLKLSAIFRTPEKTRMKKIDI